MLANSKQTFQLLGILQLLNTIFISSFLSAKNWPWINADITCIAFDNALIMVKIKIKYFPCHLTCNFRTKTRFASPGHILTLCIKIRDHNMWIGKHTCVPASHMLNSYAKMPDLGR